MGWDGMLYIMRHGKTDWNLARRLQGKTDIPLNETGRRMAEEARLRCQDVPLDVCYCSPLVRAAETAEIFLRGRDIPLLRDKRLEEMGFGVYEGEVIDPDATDRPINLFFTAPEQYVPLEGAESFDHLFARTGDFLRSVIRPQLDAGKNILIVGHGAMNSSIVCQVRHLPVADFWSAGIENCRLMRLL